MEIKTLFFDLDNTLYPPTCGLWEAISLRISVFMQNQLRIPSENILSIRQYCRENFGTTLQGLKSLYPLDEEDYLAFVHDIDLDQYISPDPKLAKMLLTLPQHKIIFTNSDHTHAQRVLAVMGIERYFNQIIDIYDISPFSKPQPQSFRIALKKASETTAKRCSMIDDNAQNLEVAKRQGFFCVQVWEEFRNERPFITIPDILDLPSVLLN